MRFQSGILFLERNHLLVETFKLVVELVEVRVMALLNVVYLALQVCIHMTDLLVVSEGLLEFFESIVLGALQLTLLALEALSRCLRRGQLL